MFKGKPDGRVERKLHKYSLVKDKKICLLSTKGMKQYYNNEKVDQWGLEEVLSFCIEE